MNSNYDVVVFDVDGTMLDTSEGVLASVNYAIEKMGFQKPDDKILKSFIGPPIQNSFAQTFELCDADKEKMAALFRNRYKDYDLLKAIPYEGILEVFKWLSHNHYTVAVATYKRQDYAEKIVKHFGFGEYTNIICGSDFAGKFKKNDIIANAIQLSGVKSHHRAVMIGDSDNDALGADALDMDFIGVTYGYGFEKDNEVLGKRKIGVAHNPREIVQILSGGYVNEN